jgi:hypothetical protein
MPDVFFDGDTQHTAAPTTTTAPPPRLSRIGEGGVRAESVEKSKEEGDTVGEGGGKMADVRNIAVKSSLTQILSTVRRTSVFSNSSSSSSSRQLLRRQSSLRSKQPTLFRKPSAEEDTNETNHQRAYTKGLTAINENLGSVLERIFQHMASTELYSEGVSSSSSKADTMVSA